MSFLKSIYHWFWAWGSNIWYGRPSKDLFVIGITGTKGKSSTVELLAKILEENDESVAYYSSSEKNIAGKELEKEVTNTMPGRGRLQKFLKRAKDESVKYVILEVTSEGCVQHRHKFIDWNVGVFLNLHPEHLEAHGSYEAYREAKLSFFRYLKQSRSRKKYFVINEEDDDAPYFRDVAKDVEGSKILTFSKDDVFQMVRRIKEKNDLRWLEADFNVENVAAAYRLAKLCDVPLEVIESAIGDFEGVEGRMEFVQAEPFSVIVDYAHTPKSMREVYRSVYDYPEFKDNSRLICVFGSAGGGRDKWKRAEFGKIAADYGDVIILTSEDPYEEDPEEIIDDIKDGISEAEERPSRVLDFVDREEAIARAIYLAKEGDFVVITGIGAQDYMYTDEGKIKWSDIDVVESKLEKLYGD
ncbi:MAG: Mur ligase family protein [Candidatus Magasanikbacteria bacterium]